ncbi:MAG TPA: siderophore-interacting protein [Acidimicrobiia bacterium]|nr:siderophore-interacting protein [Acidimicrobiia bacterium]
MTTPRLRREPPRFRSVSLLRREPITPRLVRCTFGGDDLTGFPVPDPAASVRVLFPEPGTTGLVMPEWNGNEFLLPGSGGGTRLRPYIRTFTPRVTRTEGPNAPELDVDVVLHGAGVASSWVETAELGAPAAVSGPGRGYAVSADAPPHLLAGDESAIPAMSQLLEVLPATVDVIVHVEIGDAAAHHPLPPHPRADVHWHELAASTPPGDSLVAAIEAATIGDDTRVWAAGEAAAMQRIRRHLFDTRGIPRPRTTIRGYWKFGRAGTVDD